jgi:ATPase subunit of ABC transporter with duplicated ATPase domains
MIEVSQLAIQFNGKFLYKDVNLKFTKGNCYGIIGANGAGKSTFLRLLSKDLEPTYGEVIIDKKERMSILKQDQHAFDEYSVLETVLMGHKRLYDIQKRKEELYQKENLSDDENNELCNLEMEFADLDGWNAESNAAALLNNMGVVDEYHEQKMGDIDSKLKVKVLLAQALFDTPDILILDEPTNNLDIKTCEWLEEYLINFPNLVLVVSHDRYFLNEVCTHICDVDYGKIKLYVGNYDFWYQSSQLVLQQMKDQNKKAEARIKELEEFIARFSANLSKSRQATSRKKSLDKIVLTDIEPSSRRYPFIEFKMNREAGNDILYVENLTKKPFFENLSFVVHHNDKIVFLADNTHVTTTLFDILMGKIEPDSGKIKWGITITKDYLPTDNHEFFESTLSLSDWIRQYSTDQTDTFIRGWLGRMLFSGDDVFKKVNVLSGGERVRCMLSKIMLSGANVILLDDPTNHLDLETITSLNQGLTKYWGNLLFTSHDHEIIQTVANRIIAFNADNTILDKEMTYDDFIATFVRDKE